MYLSNRIMLIRRISNRDQEEMGAIVKNIVVPNMPNPSNLWPQWGKQANNKISQKKKVMSCSLHPLHRWSPKRQQLNARELKRGQCGFTFMRTHLSLSLPKTGWYKKWPSDFSADLATQIAWEQSDIMVDTVFLNVLLFSQMTMDILLS